MKSKTSLWIFLFVFLVSCGKSPEKQAQALLARSIVAHGGGEAWKDVSTLKFRKKTRLYHRDGTVESEQDQKMEFRFQPRLEGKITWVKDSIEHILTWDGAVTRYFMGANEVQNPSFLASKKRDFDAAILSVGVPWELLDGKVILSHEGQVTLENGRLVEAIRAETEPGKGAKQYYFDPNSAMMVGSEIQDGASHTLIYYLGFAEVVGLKLQGQSESWEMGEDGNKRFLRAEYLYSEYEIVK